METWKEFLKAVLSRKFAIAMVGIIALCFIAKVQPGQLAIDTQEIVSVTPMPKVPTTDEKIDWKIPLYITLITIVTVCIQGALDYFKHGDAIKLHSENPAEPEISQ